MVRSRDAWLATIAAVLGASELACKKDAVDGPAAVREVPSASAYASASPPIVGSAEGGTTQFGSVAASAPSDTASAAASASAAPSASAASKGMTEREMALAIASVLGPPPPTSSSIGLGTIGIGRVEHNACGVGRVNPSCGAMPPRREPQATINVQLLGGSEDDRRTVQTNIRARMQRCAGNAVANDPNTHGDTTLQVAIDDHGTVTHVDAQGALPEGVTACMKSSARTVKFAEGAARTIRFIVHVDRSQ